VAVPALPLDVALVHVNRADARGNGQILGPDPYFDDLFLMAAKRRGLSGERGVRALDGPPAAVGISRLWVDRVVEAPGGAAFTSCEPDYGRDEAAQRDYARLHAR